MDPSETERKATARGLLFIGRQDLQSLEISPPEMIVAVEKAFKGKATGDAELPFKPTIHPRPDCFLRALPGYLQNADIAGLKWVSAFPTNRRDGLPIVGGLVILNDPRTGLPLSVVEASLITAWRTAAVSAVATKLLARKEASVLAICGAGVQGSVHLEFLPFVLHKLKEVRIYDPDPTILNRFLERHGSSSTRYLLRGASSPQAGVNGADVVVTAAPMFEKPMEILTAEDLAKGVLCLPLDLDSYLAPSAFEACDLYFSDDADQFFELRKQGRFKHLRRIDGDYGQLLTQAVAGRQDDGQRILAVSVGIALGDLIIAHLLYRQAEVKGKGTTIKL